jgi:Flp pilus assembly protein TadD
LIKTGRIRDAIPELRRAIEQDPTSAMVHNALGNALTLMDQTKEALAEYKRAVAIEPDNPATHENIARILWSVKDYDAAWATVRSCRLVGGKLDPNFIAVLKRDSGRMQ